METSGFVPPEDPRVQGFGNFSASAANQAEINVRSEWALKRAGFARIERDVLDTPSLSDKLRTLGTKVLEKCAYLVSLP